MECTPATISDVETPCLLLNLERVQRNTTDMLDRCRTMGVKLRPHMKTHKSREVGKMATGGTKRCIVVSTLKEAEFFADDGFDDILFGSVFTGDKLPRMKRLAERLEAFHVMFDDKYGIDLLQKNPLDNGKKWSAFLKVDCGGKRSGVVWDGSDGVELAKLAHSSPAVRLTGIYTHEGNSYNAKGDEQIRAIGNTTTERVLLFGKKLIECGIPVDSVSIGATPTASKPTDSMKNLTEIHPGNYAFYDVQQHLVGSCDLDQLALRVATRVKGHFPHRNQILVDAGFTATSHDGRDRIPDGGYCLIDEHPNLRLRNLSQEVGYVEPVEGKLNFDEYPLGSLLFLLPYHACATATRHSFFYVHSGEKIVDKWNICHGW